MACARRKKSADRGTEGRSTRAEQASKDADEVGASGLSSRRLGQHAFEKVTRWLRKSCNIASASCLPDTQHPQELFVKAATQNQADLSNVFSPKKHITSQNPLDAFLHRLALMKQTIPSMPMKQRRPSAQTNNQFFPFPSLETRLSSFYTIFYTAEIDEKRPF